MDPEMLRLAQEQMRRMSPDDLARMQQQLMSNPGLLRMASESMKNMKAEDFRRAAQQMNQARPEDLRDMTEKLASTTPEEFAAMRAQADAQMSYAISGAKMLKRQGNELHSLGQYSDAASKYKLAKDNLKNVPSSAALTLQLQCTLNLMACYLKTGQFDECVSEGSEVLASDSSNVKAYYRRGQAYKELGRLEAAIADLSKAHEISPEDETIAEVLRDAEEKLAREGGGLNMRKGVVIEELVEDDDTSQPSSNQRSSPGYTVSQPPEGASSSSTYPPCTADMQETMRNSMKDPATRQMLANMMKNMSPEMMANMSEQFGMKMSKEDAAKAPQAMSSLSPEDLDRMMRWMERAQKGVEVAKKTKDWLLGRRGLILAVVMLILAFILHQLEFMMA
ncbi:unnamed protein product [Urochloa decumbens]|uniref:Outer envelope protein 61 n=1 Tax=Urochloa decumbens TaxID=240449 RepID=A0ABC9G6S0_9POAL